MIDIDYNVKNKLKSDFFKNEDKNILEKIKPEILCLYLSDQNWERDYKTNLLNNNAWSSKLEKLNDPFEGKIAWDETANEDVMEKYNNLYSIIISAFLTEFNDDILMWSYYAHQHKGICIEYKFEDVYDLYKDSLYPVLYNERYNLLSGDNNTNNKQRIIECFYTKSQCWIHEQEWRLAHVLGEGEKSLDGKEINMPPIAKIHFGYNVKESDKLYKDIIKFQKSKPEISLDRMILDEKNYKLIVETLF